jgi:hypothetical protein
MKRMVSYLCDVGAEVALCREASMVAVIHAHCGGLDVIRRRPVACVRLA